MILKDRITESIDRKMKMGGSLLLSGLFLPIRRMKVIERLLTKNDRNLDNDKS